MTLDGFTLFRSLEALDFARDAFQPDPLEQAGRDPAARLLLKPILKMASIDADVAEVRRAAGGVADAKARWHVDMPARGEVLFLEGRDRPFRLPKDLVRSVAEGADLDTEVGREEDKEGSPVVVFKYAGSRPVGQS